MRHRVPKLLGTRISRLHMREVVGQADGRLPVARRAVPRQLVAVDQRGDPREQLAGIAGPEPRVVGRDPRELVDESQGAQVSCDNRVRLDFNQHLGRDERRHLHHRRRGPDGAEHLAVRAPHGLPLADVGDVDPRAHDVFQAGAGLLECGRNVL